MAAGIVGTWPPVPNTITYLPSTISPLAGMEPPAFPTAPDLARTKSGEMENNMLLEVLNHCRMLQTAVQRLEQKIDNLQSNQCITGGCRTQAIPQEGHFGTGQLSWSLAQRLGPSPQTNHRWYPPWKCSSASQAPDLTDPVQSDQCSFRNSSGTRGGGRGKGRRRDRWGGARRGAQSQQPDTENLQAKLEPLLDEVFPKKEESQPSKISKKAPHLDKVVKKLKKQKKRPAVAESKPKDEVPIKVEDMSTVKEDKKVMIGSASRNVWIPMSVYMHVFKEEEPQKAVVPVLHTLFPISTLSCSAITSNPLRGIQLLDPNKLEALREWLAEMYPQHDMRVRGVAWAECLGVINSITKDLRRREEISGEGEAPQL
ncbi:hypothetical protein AMEX_G16369 [Astyanax mexicanus]|uniref:BEN domain-containing protein n=1 Tax=Astyanax mexicanus TaxID=7994 RepID=A0A8T2LHM4_ASTMX|nr:hypothetical protein AMEX_G16369 [Astyanax mexicanus]